MDSLEKIRKNLGARPLVKLPPAGFREWAFRPGLVWFALKSLNSWAGFKSAVDMGIQTLGWLRK